MRGCVIGAGPSGLYTAKYLAGKGIPITIYEKSNEILGNYKYAITKGSSLNDIVSSRNIELNLNGDSSQIDDRKYNFYVVATGAVPKRLNIEGEEACIGGLEIVQRHYKNDIPDLGDRVCIIGMGNVAFDIIRYIRGKCKDVTVLSNRNYLESPFDNHILKDIVDDGRWDINTNAEVGNANSAGDHRVGFFDRLLTERSDTNERRSDMNLLSNPKDESTGTNNLSGGGTQEMSTLNNTSESIRSTASRRSSRRMQIFQNIIHNQVKNIKSYFSDAKTTVTLLFNTGLERIGRKGNKIEVSYRSGNKLNRELFDNVIVSIGFIPNPAPISTNKPVFYTGWCVDPRGNINDAQHDARICAENIIRSLYGH